MAARRVNVSRLGNAVTRRARRNGSRRVLITFPSPTERILAGVVRLYRDMGFYVERTPGGVLVQGEPGQQLDAKTVRDYLPGSLAKVAVVTAGNPAAALSESKTLRDVMWDVQIAEQAFLTGKAKKGSETLDKVRLRLAQLAQLAERGIHTNPATLAIVGNPPRRRRARRNPGGCRAEGRLLGKRVYRILYEHVRQGKRYHDFSAGAKLEMLSDGSLRLYHPTHPLWTRQ